MADLLLLAITWKQTARSQQPGDYLKKGHLTGPSPHLPPEEQLLTLRDAGRAALTPAPTTAGA